MRKNPGFLFFGKKPLNRNLMQFSYRMFLFFLPEISKAGKKHFTRFFTKRAGWYPASSIHPSSSNEYPASSIQHRVSSIQHLSSILQQRVPSIEHPATSIPAWGLQHRESVFNHFTTLFRPCRGHIFVETRRREKNSPSLFGEGRGRGGRVWVCR